MRCTETKLISEKPRSSKKSSREKSSREKSSRMTSSREKSSREKSSSKESTVYDVKEREVHGGVFKTLTLTFFRSCFIDEDNWQADFVTLFSKYEKNTCLL